MSSLAKSPLELVEERILFAAKEEIKSKHASNLSDSIGVVLREKPHLSLAWLHAFVAETLKSKYGDREEAA